MLIVFIFIPSPTSGSSTNDGSASRKHNVTSGAKLLNCGEKHSNEEARAMGCSYDVLLNAWVPAPCFDNEYVHPPLSSSNSTLLTQLPKRFVVEYLDDFSSTAYADIELTQPLKSIDEMVEANGGKHYYTSKRDHVNHCATLWKKQFWVLFEERKAKDTFMVNGGHTDHCATYLMQAADMDQSVATRVDVGFAGCWVKE